nr:hypothetical protein CFP56_67318 [Quercus suber]
MDADGKRCLYVLRSAVLRSLPRYISIQTLTHKKKGSLLLILNVTCVKNTDLSVGSGGQVGECSDGSAARDLPRFF